MRYCRPLLLSMILLPLFGCRWFGHQAEEQQALLQRGQAAATAQEAVLHNTPGETARYADRLEELLAWEPSLTDDPTVTFEFKVSADDDSAFVLRRAGDDWRVWCDADPGCRVEEKK
ncbi:MAG: hypothetical protein GX444_15130 [Myxococcales bacterium]|nr:hypothetical protein [Myxococcales bacterium]